jgi:hypothetical protein
MKSTNERKILTIFVITITLTLFVTTVFSYDARIKWDQSPAQGLVSYNIYRSLVSGNFTPDKKIGTVSKDVLEYCDHDLQKGTIYYYAVTAVGSGNTESDYSDQISLSPMDYGDTNNDTKITPGDALLVLKFYDQSIVPTLSQKYSADMNHDGNITPMDALCVLKKFIQEQAAMCPE